MNRQAARLEQLLIELAHHIDQSAGAVRLVYDDHHAGDRLALVARGSSGIAELQIWRETNSKLKPRLHLVADGAAICGDLSNWIQAWIDPMPWSSRGMRSFAERIKGLADELSASFDARLQGYPDDALTKLAAGLGDARRLAGVTGPLKGNQAEPLAVVAGGQGASLWAAAVTSPDASASGSVSERALLWDPQARAFIVPRELRALLSRRAPLPEITQQWSSWCLAPPPPQIVEQQLADIDFRGQAKGHRDGCSDCADECIDCVIFSDLLCIPLECGLIDLECAALECGALESIGECGLLDCGALDCGALDILSCG